MPWVRQGGTCERWKVRGPCWNSVTGLGRVEAAELGAVLPILLFGHDAWRDPSLKPQLCFGLEEIDYSVPQSRVWM